MTTRCVEDAGELADPRFRYVVVEDGKVIAGFRRETQAQAFRMQLGISTRKVSNVAPKNVGKAAEFGTFR